jgi:phage terminase large subunit GpA-like protein
MVEWTKTKAGERAHRAAAAAFKPPPNLSVSQWADRERFLSPESSAEPGRWRTTRVPYLKEIMDSLTDPAVKKVVVIKSSQVGFTQGVLGNVLAYHMDQDPAPVLVIQPTLEMAEAWSRDFLAPMIRDTPALVGKVSDPRSREGDSSIRRKQFPGGQLTVIGSNSPSGLRMRPVRIILADEVDAWPVSAGSAGDPLALAQNRSVTFWSAKTLVGSTPLLKHGSVILREYEQSDKRQYHVPCPACSELQVLKWRGGEGDNVAGVRWDRGADGEHLPETAQYVCEHCGGLWSDSERHAAIKQGKWIAENPGGAIAGFKISSLLSPFLSLADLARKFLACRGDIDLLKTFINECLGEPWEDAAEKIDGASLISRGESYSPQTVPAGVAIVTAGIDTQSDRLEIQVIGWGAHEESWLLAHEVLHGDPAQTMVWDELDQMLLTPMHNENGRELRIRAACIDTGGHHANAVHGFCRPRRGRRIFPTKGIAGPRPVWPRRASKTHDKKNEVFLIGVDTAKDALYGRLRIGKPGPGYIHFPVGQGFDDEFFRQLTSEQVVTRKREGRPYRVWILPPGRRNEALDCWNLALAARLSIRVRLVADQQSIAVPLQSESEEPDMSDMPEAIIPPTEPPPSPPPPALGPGGARPVKHSAFAAAEQGWFASRNGRSWWDRGRRY